jgi:SAM-dependent methyltransferase
MRHDDESSESASAGAVVQAFYERYPYPRPIDTLDAYRALWQDPRRRRADHHLHWPMRPYGEQRSILVAGCGTSQAAKHALRWPGARVVGIDFSATSVRCTEELKEKYRLDNLEVRQLPLERAGELGVRFDQVVCTGVLHHLKDPDAGLRALSEVLHPDGALHLMVYAPYGRTGIYMMQEFCRRLGIGATDTDIRALVGTLKHLPAAHPLHALLRESPDFRNEAALADALLHPQDRAYSVPQLFEFLAGAGLALTRFVRQAPYRPECGSMAHAPQYDAIMKLPFAERAALAEIFRGTMIRHSVVAHHAGSTAAFVPDFSGDTWLRYVPIRSPDTVEVEEHLPPRAVAVLINRTHTDRDLYLPIDAAEKRLLDRIDGTRSIGDIGRGLADAEVLRSFFERLWWYDQIVVDASTIIS